MKPEKREFHNATCHKKREYECLGIPYMPDEDGKFRMAGFKFDYMTLKRCKHCGIEILFCNGMKPLEDNVNFTKIDGAFVWDGSDTYKKFRLALTKKPAA